MLVLHFQWFVSHVRVSVSRHFRYSTWYFRYAQPVQEPDGVHGSIVLVLSGAPG
jgi:hypothetical protein